MEAIQIKKRTRHERERPNKNKNGNVKSSGPQEAASRALQPYFRYTSDLSLERAWRDTRSISSDRKSDLMRGLG
jgi:hypothetical protein